ncbi:MAG: putative toxin-antitoxin system toxin component, PIN family [bacterium]|nr:putative toxin-antitoxin system toxin component, PIN family [bacterium]
MKVYQVVLDTNVLVAALRSKRGTAFKLLSQIDSKKFKINLSVPLLLEYEDVLKRKEMDLSLDIEGIDDILDYLCKIADKREIFYLWRPYLIDPKDDFILELAVESQSEFIITYNLKDFKAVDKFGIKAITPKEFLEFIGGR